MARASPLGRALQATGDILSTALMGLQFDRLYYY